MTLQYRQLGVEFYVTVAVANGALYLSHSVLVRATSVQLCWVRDQTKHQFLCKICKGIEWCLASPPGHAGECD